MTDTTTNSRRLGRYELKEEIGKGGMATVYRGYDHTLKRHVAIKLLHQHLTSNAEARARFEREAESVARLSSSHIVEIYDFDHTPDGDVFLVMELVEGTTLRDFVDARSDHPIMAEAAALIVRNVLLALMEAHQRGIVHRDVKPENILIDHRGHIKLSDFGIAYLADIGQMTTTGQILGSPCYMSPEHIEKPQVDARSDLFSVGSVMYEMTVGAPPFVGNNPHQIIKRVVEGYYNNPLNANPAIGHSVSAFIVKCLQPQPEQRFQTAREAIDHLDGILAQLETESLDNAQRSYLASPETWEQSHLPRIIKTTLTQGQHARKNHRLPEAMNHLNRVLTLDPGNEEALKLVTILSRRRQFKRNVERVGTATLVLILLAASILLLMKFVIPPKADHSASMPIDSPESLPPLTHSPHADTADTENAVTSADTGDSDSVPGKPSTQERIVIVEKSPSPSTQRRRPPEPNTPSEPSVRTVVFTPHPMRVDIAIDGEDRFAYKTTDRQRLLTSGPHTITFYPEDDRLLPLTRRVHIPDGHGPYTVKARLKWKPGTLRINSNVNGVVSSGGRAIGRTNQSIEIDIKNGPTTEIPLLISHSGFLPSEYRVSISAGETTTINAQLMPDPGTPNS